MVRVVSGAFALPFTGASLPAEAVGISPQVGGINGGIATQDYLQRYGLGNKLVETLIENVLAQVVSQIGEGTI